MCLFDCKYFSWICCVLKNNSRESYNQPLGLINLGAPKYGGKWNQREVMCEY